MRERNKEPLLCNSKTLRTTQGSDEDLPNCLKPTSGTEAGKLRVHGGGLRRALANVHFPWRKRPKVQASSVLTDSEAQFSLPARNKPCRVTLIFDPAGTLCYYWSMVVSVAFLYNLWVISYRFAFEEITLETVQLWFTLDYSADFIYLLDLLMGFRTAFLNKDGVLQTNGKRIRLHFVNTSQFYLSCLSLLPIDFLYLSIQFRSIVRSIRLVKVYTFMSFVDSTERHTNHPNFCRGFLIIHNLLLVFHWNACLIFFATKDTDVSHNWLKVPEKSWNASDMFYTYWKAQFLSCGLLLPTAESQVSESDTPNRIGVFILAMEQIMGVLLFAIVIGYVVNIVSHMSYARKQFQGTVW